jgi:hypothetical protein
MAYNALKTLPECSVKLLIPSGHYIYHQVQQSQILRSAHTLYLCVLCGSENKQRLFPYTALTRRFYNRDEVCLLRGTDLVFKSDRYSFVIKGLLVRKP